MVLVMFALLLLSVVGLGMMYSTNMESSINYNYRDKQVAIYSALAGLQEARDRIQPATQNIVAPTILPSYVATANASTAGVIYIVANSSVNPTDPANKYFDTELCHEQVFGLTGTPGMPCTAAPAAVSGQTWHRPFVDNSSSASAPWNLSAPLDVKWVRVTLKGNNMTPVAANGNSGTSTQVCWNGTRQVLLPGGYGGNCAPNGSVASVTLTNPGNGYTTTPTVTLSAPPSGGTQATASAAMTTVSNGQVASITLVAGGTGYTSAPAVTLSGGGGSGATATATVGLAGSPVESITVTNAGTQCYSVPPSVSITGGGGVGAVATAVLSSTASCVYSWNPTASCGNPWKGDTETGITLSGGGGSGFSGTITFHSSGHSITSHSIQNPGDGYTSAPTTAGGGSPDPLTAGCVVTPNAIVGKRLQSVNVTNGGSGYTSVPSITFSSGSGTAASLPTGTATLGPSTGAGDVLSVAVTNPGSGYTTPPVVTFSGGGGGSGASATAALGVTNTITGITLLNPGSGYLIEPTVTLSAPPSGTTATATATIGRGTNYGKVYVLTSLAETATGARSMAQMEVASPVLGFATPGALTLDGPNPIIGAMPNSNNFVITGADANSCSQTAEADRPAIAGYDDPNADPPTHSVDTIISELPRPDHYTGYGGTPSVVNGYHALGDTMGTTTGLKALIDAIHAAPGANIYGSDPGSIELGTSTSPIVDYVDGDLTLSGNNTGYGILVVTGTLHFSGNFSWYGLVLVVGDGVADFSGGGNGNIVGSVLIAKIWDSYTTKNLLASLGSPTVDWNGGGGNGISYDHCWATNLMHGIPFTPPASTRPLKILSVKTLPY
jgi:hypothetical protein